MQDRRTFLEIAAASLLPASLFPVGLAAQTPAARPPTELARHPLTGPFDGFEVVLLELNMPPGARSAGPGHRHPGRVHTTNGSARPDGPTRAVVFMLVPKGVPLTAPA